MIIERASTDGAIALGVSPATKETFRNGMAKLAAAVNIVTSDGPAGLAGFAATAVCSVTDQPPTLLVCLNRNASVYEAVTKNGVLAVNTLAAHHVALSNLFGGKTPVDERFAAATWLRGETGAPLLADALTAFDCRITQHIDIGTHTVLICTVAGIAGEGGPAGLTYFERAYHSVGAEPGRV
jgi:flavin reductase